MSCVRQGKNVEISKTLCGQESYFSFSSAAKHFVRLGGGSDVHRWHSCGRLKRAADFCKLGYVDPDLKPPLGSAPPCNGLGLPTGSIGCAEVGTVVSGWYPEMWLTAYESLKHFFQFFRQKRQSSPEHDKMLTDEM